MYKRQYLKFTAESRKNKGRYLTHINVPIKGCTGQLLADKIYEVLCEYSSVYSILTILLDNKSQSKKVKNKSSRFQSSILIYTGCPKLSWHVISLNYEDNTYSFLSQ